VSRTTSAIDGVLMRALTMHGDARGSVTELYQADGDAGIQPLQWHLLVSNAGTLRGMHLHVRHLDYKVVAGGRLALMLMDLRAGSPTDGVAECHELSGESLMSVLIPPGVAHGVLSHDDTLTMVASSALYDPADEFEFAWDDPALGVPWPGRPVMLSERDRNAGSVAGLRAELEQLGPLWAPGDQAATV
jgi:dTDP-4-dehydrorhamnose 3,5-epimerase